jgi:4-hydroxy-3-methylbut-2-enyl diphosphate reductase
VHNEIVINELSTLGMITVNSIDEIPDGSRVLFSAHGVSPKIHKIAQKKNLKVIDTTCPFVLKIHQWVKKLEQSGVPIVLIGKKGHAEIQGTLGQLNNLKNVFVVSDVLDVQKLPDMDEVGVAMQTTLGVLETHEIVESLKKRFSKVLIQNGICQATTERQNAVLNAKFRAFYFGTNKQ